MLIRLTASLLRAMLGIYVPFTPAKRTRSEIQSPLWIVRPNQFGGRILNQGWAIPDAISNIRPPTFEMIRI
jgi:hypothetical protein